MEINTAVKQEMHWWLHNILHLTKPIYRQQPDDTYYTDASMEGWGCHHPGSNTSCGGRWSDGEQKDHINCLESLAVLLALQSKCDKLTKQHIRIFSDNTTAVTAVNKQGSVRNAKINNIARKVWLFAIERELWLSAAHCPGSENVEADRASRVFRDETEWTLEKSLFRAICQRFGKPDIDLFAARNNHQVTRYCAWQPDPGAIFIDAFQYDWGNGEKFYIFPPFNLLGAVIQKIILDKGHGILIAPFWPTKPWFTQMAKLIVGESALIQVHDSTLFIPGRKDKTHPLAGKLQLLVCPVSGIASEGRAFRRQLQERSKMQPDYQPGNYTDPTCRDGTLIACQGTWIPYTALQCTS